MEYISLRTSSTFSICQAYGMPDQIAERAVELGQEAVCLTERGNTSSHPKLEKAAKSQGVKPIYGVILNLVERHEDKDRFKDNVLVLAKDLDGYKQMLQLSNMAYKPDHFYYVPTVEYQELYEHQDGLVVLTGSALDGDVDEAEERLKEMANNIDDLYVEVDISKDTMHKRQARMLARGAGVPAVATNDVQFLRQGQEELIYFLTGVKSKKGGRRVAETSRMVGTEQILEWGATDQEVSEAVKIVQRIEEFDLPKAERVKSGAPEPYEELVQQCRDGWRERGIPRDQWKEYKERLFRELHLIRDKGFTDYFLVVSDLIQWAKEQDIMVGPARGSAASSLVSYLIGITEVDPIRWDLLFERFIDESRKDDPDIDIDFQDDRRGEIAEYLKSKYGQRHVSNIAGYSLFKPKSLLDDMGRVYKIPKRQIERAKGDLMENGGNMTLQQALDEHFPDYSELSQAEGMVRHLTVHAAGIVVASEELNTFTTVGRDGLMLDMRDAEYMGLMKIDVLSLSTLTILDKCVRAIGERPEWLYKSVPLDDKATFDAFSGDYFQGIFQYEGGTTKRVCQQIAPTKFNELIDINALSRPGPLSSGATDAYINGEAEDIHPVVTKHTERSRGQILFQEQIMKILREAGGLEWADVTAVRKLITKNEGAEKLEGIRQRFIDNFEDKETAQKIWDSIGESGSYSFNVAHSTSYTFLGYYCMYLKIYHPLEFYWANLAVEPDNEGMLQEYIQRGGKVYGVKFGKSGASWTMEEDGIRAGFMTLNGIGPKSAQKLERGELPKGKAEGVLREAGAFDEDDEPVDYLGIYEVRDQMEKEVGRERIGDLVPGNYVRVGGKIVELAIKNLRYVVENQGRDYEEEVDKPEYNMYVNMTIMDETGEINATINRFKYHKNEEVIQALEKGDLIILTGKYSKEYRKVHAKKFEVVGSSKE